MTLHTTSSMQTWPCKRYLERKLALHVLHQPHRPVVVKLNLGPTEGSPGLGGLRRSLILFLGGSRYQELGPNPGNYGTAICMCVCIHTYTYICVHMIYIYIYICTYVYTPMNIYIYIYMLIHRYVYHAGLLTINSRFHASVIFSPRTKLSGSVSIGEPAKAQSRE